MATVGHRDRQALGLQQPVWLSHPGEHAARPSVAGLHPPFNRCIPLLTSLENPVPQGVKRSVVALLCPTLAVTCELAYSHLSNGLGHPPI